MKGREGALPYRPATELVYTGITRARDWLTLVETGRGMLDEAVTRVVVRVSGLGSHLTT